MRSGHSLAFRQFEDVLSDISIAPLDDKDKDVVGLCKVNNIDPQLAKVPFTISWEADSDWEPDDLDAVSAGSCLIVPIPDGDSKGLLLRSKGYAEAEQAIGSFSFLDDGTFCLNTKYGQSIAEERIWFVSNHVRCRSSVLRTSAGSGVLQTSFSSEVRKLRVVT